MRRKIHRGQQARWREVKGLTSLTKPSNVKEISGRGIQTWGNRAIMVFKNWCRAKLYSYWGPHGVGTAVKRQLRPLMSCFFHDFSRVTGQYCVNGYYSSCHVTSNFSNRETQNHHNSHNFRWYGLISTAVLLSLSFEIREAFCHSFAMLIFRMFF